MSAKIAMALMGALVLATTAAATIQSASAQSRYNGYSGYQYGEPPNEVARDRECATGCGGGN